MILRKVKFKDLSSLATKESYFIFNNIQIDGVITGSPLGPSLANAFLAYHEQNWLERCLLEYIQPAYSVSIVNFDHVIAGWVTIILSMVSLRETCPNKEFFSGPYLKTFYAVCYLHICTFQII